MSFLSPSFPNIPLFQYSSIPILQYLLGPVAQLVEQLTLNQLVQGSNPCRPTREIKGLTQIGLGPFFLGTLYIIPIPYNNWDPNTSQMGAKAV